MHVHRSSQAERKAAAHARPLARQGELFISHRELVRNEPCMSKFCAIHVHVRTSPLACTCTAVRYSRSAQYPCPLDLLAPAAPQQGGETRPGETMPAYVPTATAKPTPAYVPAATALPYIYRHTAAAGMRIFMRITRGLPLDCSVSITRSTPSPAPGAPGRGGGAKPRSCTLQRRPMHGHDQQISQNWGKYLARGDAFHL